MREQADPDSGHSLDARHEVALVQRVSVGNTLYGYLWWLGRVDADGRVARTIAAQRRGGQYVRIVPELDLVVAVTAGYYQDYSAQAFRTQYGVFRDVVRAAMSPRG